jgi:hypothetical protein
VSALNGTTGIPDKGLTRDDFQVFDNGRPVSIATFDTGTQTRPLGLWFVVQCNMQGWEKEGSGLFAGQGSLFKPALKHLDNRDKVAVAHWCDDGQSKLDLLPTSNIEEATTSLEQVLTSGPSPKDHSRTGELAFQKTLQLIIDKTHSLVPEPLPVVIFLYGDYSGMPKSEANCCRSFVYIVGSMRLSRPAVLSTVAAVTAVSDLWFAQDIPAVRIDEVLRSWWCTPFDTRKSSTAT